MRAEGVKGKTEPLSMVLVAIAALLGAVALVVVARFFMASVSNELAAAEALRPTVTEPNTVAEQRALTKSVADGLKKKNLFVTPPAKRHPVAEVLGILGNEALINNRWYKAGDRVGDARILAIEATKVRIVWDGQEKEFSPLGAGGGGPPGGDSSGRRPPSRPGAPRVVNDASPRTPRPSSQERAAMRERFRTMSPEEQQKFREEMRGRASGRSR